MDDDFTLVVYIGTVGTMVNQYKFFTAALDAGVRPGNTFIIQYQIVVALTAHCNTGLKMIDLYYKIATS
jgi:hypothetical protein